MEAIIFNSYGGRMPDVIKEKLGSNLEFPKCRFDQSIIDFIKTNAVEFNPDVHSDRWFNHNKNAIVKMDKGEWGTKYFGFSTNDNSKYGIITGFYIKDIDTNRRWTLSEYDGVEVIEYIDDYECKSEELNYWVRKENDSWT